MYKKIDFRSYPYLQKETINLVSKLLRQKNLSNFVGSKVETNIEKMLKQIF